MRDCMPTSMLLYTMLQIMSAYLMMLTALFNAACAMLIFMQLTFANAFCFDDLSGVIDT